VDVAATEIGRSFLIAASLETPDQRTRSRLKRTRTAFRGLTFHDSRFEQGD
jgi:hypothetical protein